MTHSSICHDTRTWGILALTFAFGWFAYTKWLLVEMHECVPGRRISRFMDLAEIAFGTYILPDKSYSSEILARDGKRRYVERFDVGIDLHYFKTPNCNVGRIAVAQIVRLNKLLTTFEVTNQFAALTCSIGHYDSGERQGFFIAAPLVIPVAAGTCIGLITIGGTSLKLLFLTACPTCNSPLTVPRFYVVLRPPCPLSESELCSWSIPNWRCHGARLLHSGLVSFDQCAQTALSKV
jgi:hypothetical protein